MHQFFFCPTGFHASVKTAPVWFCGAFSVWLKNHRKKHLWRLHKPVISTWLYSPTEPLTILEPQNPTIGIFKLNKTRQSTDFKARKLLNVRWRGVMKNGMWGVLGSSTNIKYLFFTRIFFRKPDKKSEIPSRHDKPDRPFHNFRALKSVDWRVLTK